jgi:DNA primase
VSKFTPDTIDRVRTAADMVEIVSAHTELKRAGARYQGLCPFHDERSPSFSVHAEEKLYHCFGCGVGGDLFDFVCEKEGIDFPQAVELLAERYGVEVKRDKEDPEAEKRRKERDRLQQLLERSASFYAATYRDSEEAAKSREYLASRGLEAGALESFGVGFAPSAWDTLIVRAQRAGFSPQEMATVGLAQKGKNGGMYDRFRSRIMFPIRDARGRVVGFGARATREDQKPKYLNTAETSFFRKSEILYGIDLARPAMAKAGRAILVEGYTDVIALHQAGLTETVGIMGTAMTEHQIARLSATVDTVVLALDADAAGQKAMLRAQEVAAGRKVTILVVAMPAGEDPAEIATAPGGPDRFREMLDAAVVLPEFHLSLILDSVDPASPRSRDDGLTGAVPVILGVEPGALRNELIRRTADGLGIEPSVVVSRLEKGPDPGGSTSLSQPAESVAEAAPLAAPVLSKRERRERSLLVMCIANPSEGREWLGRLEERHLSGPLMVRTAAWLSGNLDDPMEGLDKDDPELYRLVSAMVVRADPELVGKGAIRRNFMELELAALEEEISAAKDASPEVRADLNRRRSDLIEQVRKAEDERAAS